MGLDLYVGSLTRYYSGDWETIVARTAREQGVGYRVVNADPKPKDAVTDPEQIRPMIEQWRQGLEQGLRAHLASGLSWEESAEAPYFSDKPDWTGYAGVAILAAQQLHPESPLPEKVPAQFAKDPAYQALAQERFRGDYAQLFEVEIWFPSDFPFVFQAQDLAGNEVRFGSAAQLLAQLKKLNERTLKGDAGSLERWKREGAGPADSFAKASQFGLSMFLHHAELAVKHRLPMKLDY